MNVQGISWLLMLVGGTRLSNLEARCPVSCCASSFTTRFVRSRNLANGESLAVSQLFLILTQEELELGVLLYKLYCNVALWTNDQ